MQRQGTVKRLAAAVIALSAMAVMGGPSSALALGFNFGDLGFFVYGGDTERYENFGTGSTVPTLEGTSVTTRNISADLATLNAGASTGLRYSLLGLSADGANFYFTTPNSTLSSAQQAGIFASGGAGEFFGFQAQHGAATGGVLENNPSLTPRAAAHSFTSMLGTDGRLNGQFTTITTQASIGSDLSIWRVNVDGLTEMYTKVGTVLLANSGQLTITPTAVPVPAAVVLFGTGLVGLVGLARRKMQGLAA